MPRSLGGYPRLGEWRFIELLNRLRNRLAHNAEVSNLEEQVHRTINCLTNVSNEVFESPRRRATAFKNSVMLVCAVLEGISIEQVELRRASERPPGSKASGVKPQNRR